ncbi:MAG: hypothetical protein OEM02_11760 [Desulfobulbaceae bacterium]|nr:hypothetical protein [Desulfobulbaceae bacterium]
MLCQIEDWRIFIKDGEQYLNTALAADKKKSTVFTPEILYNITAMAIEKYLMGFLMYNNDLADNHTMADLLDSIKRHVTPSPSMIEDLLYIDSFQDICDTFNATYKIPRPEEMQRILSIGQKVRDFTISKVTPLAA